MSKTEVSRTSRGHASGNGPPAAMQTDSLFSRIRRARRVALGKFVHKRVMPTKQYWLRSKFRIELTVRSSRSTSCPACLKHEASWVIPSGGSSFGSKARAKTSSVLAEEGKV